MHFHLFFSAQHTMLITLSCAFYRSSRLSNIHSLKFYFPKENKKTQEKFLSFLENIKKVLFYNPFLALFIK